MIKKTSIYYDVANVQVLKTLLYLNGMQLILHWHFSSYKHFKKTSTEKHKVDDYTAASSV